MHQWETTTQRHLLFHILFPLILLHDVSPYGIHILHCEDNYQKVSSSKEESISVLEGQFL